MSNQTVNKDKLSNKVEALNKFHLDTHIFIWAITEPERLGKNARNLLENRRNQLYLWCC